MLRPLCVSMLALLASAHPALAADDHPLSKYDSWESYYAAHREELNGRLDITADSLENCVPEYIKNGFILRRIKGPQWIDTVTTRTITSVLPIVFAQDYDSKGNIITIDTWRSLYDYLVARGEITDYFPTPEDWKRYGEASCSESGGELSTMVAIDGREYCREQPWDTTTETSRERRHREWEFSLVPILFFDLDLTHKLVSLQNYAEQGVVSSQRMNQETDFAIPLLDRPDPGKGFILTRGHSWDLALGVAGNWHWNYAEGIRRILSFYVGIAPVKGHRVEFTYLLDHRNEASQVPARVIPYHASDLDGWKKGESVQFATTGGVLFSAGPALGPIAAGPVYVAQGTWETTVQKLDEKKVHVKLTKSQLTAFSVAADIGLASLGVTKFNNADEGFSFMMDLSDEKAVLAFQDFMKGSLLPAQELAADPTRIAVIAVKTEKRLSAGRLRTLSIGLPILINASSSEGMIHTESNTEFHPDGSKTEAEYGMFLKNERSRFFFNKRAEGMVFYGAAYKNTHKDGATDSGHFGEFVWNYENTDTQAIELHTALEDLAQLTGLQHEIAVKLAPDLEQTANLGYSHVKLNLRVNQVATDMLMKAAVNPETALIFHKVAKGFAQSYFDAGDPNGHCAYADDGQLPCEQRLKQQALHATHQMVLALKDMDAHRAEPRAFADAYARFGRAVLKSPFAFQALLNIGKGRGVTLGFEVSGESVPRFSKILQWIPEVVK